MYNRNIFEQLDRSFRPQIITPTLIYGPKAVGKTYTAQRWGMKNFDAVLYVSFKVYANTLDAISILSSNRDINDMRILARQRKRLLREFRANKDPREAIRLLLENFTNKLAEKQIQIDKLLIILDDIENIPQLFSRFSQLASTENVRILGICGSFVTPIENALYYKRKMGILTADLKAEQKQRQRAGSLSKLNLIKMHPMTFLEYLTVIGEANSDHDKMMGLIQDYMAVGGLPKCVKIWQKTADISKVRAEQARVLGDIKDCIKASLSFVHHPKVDEIISAIASQLGIKFMLSKIDKNIRAREYAEVFDKLDSHFFAYKVCRANSPNASNTPLQQTKLENSFKLYPCDVGLLSLLQGSEDTTSTKDENFEKTTYNSLFEQVVLQELISQTDELPLYYASETGKSSLPFLFQLGPEVIPVEINPYSNTKAKNLNVYIDKYNPRLAIRVYDSKVHRAGALLEIPPYEMGKL